MGWFFKKTKEPKNSSMSSKKENIFENDIKQVLETRAYSEKRAITYFDKERDAFDAFKRPILRTVSLLTEMLIDYPYLAKRLNTKSIRIPLNYKNSKNGYKDGFVYSVELYKFMDFAFKEHALFISREGTLICAKKWNGWEGDRMYTIVPLDIELVFEGARYHGGLKKIIIEGNDEKDFLRALTYWTYVLDDTNATNYLRNHNINCTNQIRDEEDTIKLIKGFLLLRAQ